MARSAAEKAGTCEYIDDESSRSSMALTSRTTNDSSQRSGCMRHKG